MRTKIIAAIIFLAVIFAINFLASCSSERVYSGGCKQHKGMTGY